MKGGDGDLWSCLDVWGAYVGIGGDLRRWKEMGGDRKRWVGIGGDGWAEVNIEYAF